ncbi:MULTISPECIES: CcdB family protein [Methylomonas]|uniref:CcdB family protein n=1 Tax=Methylomonas TaxID=416 RepID=UPI0012322BA5|nr:CcdB family protein [Methylomonas rhizoryzae]
MAQFVLYRNTNRQTQGRYPFLLDVQSDFLDGLKTRPVISAVNLVEQKPITRLNPVFEFERQHYLLAVQETAVIPANNPGGKATELDALRGEILAAADLPITGI